QSALGSIKIYANGNITITSLQTSTTGNLSVGTGATGTFVSVDMKVVTVQNGIVVSIIGAT
ncbi:unnamed protein product, partial [marine sediment metagenome]